ncbi:MAG TPA: hypothetical protein DET40_04870 [Lentisphaeria bacterium]|nr:MAG: hypothetical protein A2X45_13445 [Lentisphaerae bacterium GWF2_50_93]HCE42858.1 hypothetical protein [Lentisphaeria bacterium]
MNEFNLKAEARNCFNYDFERAKGATDKAIVPLEETIKIHDIAEYRIPYFVLETVGELEYNRLKNILLEIHDVNNSFAGMKTKEIEVYLALSDDYDGIKEKLSSWVRDYLSSRLEKPSFKDKSELDKFCRLLKEYDNIFTHINLMDNAVNYCFLWPMLRYAKWFLYSRTWKKDLEVTYREGDYEPYVNYPTGKYSEKHIQSILEYELNILDLSLRLMKGNLDAGRLDKAANMSEETLLANMAEMASEMQGMRFLLNKNYHIQKSSIAVGGGYRLFWEWRINGGIGAVYVTDKEVPLVLDPMVIVNSKGVIANPPKPWENILESGSRDLLPVNYLMLEMVWEKLSSMYEKIDFDSIRRNKDKDDDEKLLLSCSDIASLEECRVETTESKRRKMILGPLRYGQLTGFLSRKFGCEVRDGKGSERVITRPGGKCFILGHHKNNPIHHPIVIKRMLKGLNIPLEDWYNTVYAGGN